MRSEHLVHLLRSFGERDLLAPACEEEKFVLLDDDGLEEKASRLLKNKRWIISIPYGNKQKSRLERERL
jgi:hypothetical protein